MMITMALIEIIELVSSLVLIVMKPLRYLMSLTDSGFTASSPAG